MSDDIETVRIIGDEVLRRRADDVEDFGEELRALADRMADIMYESNGIGLAGPQIGVSKRITVIDHSLGERVDDLLVLVNPDIVETSGECMLEEGCLSVPGIYEELLRPERVVCRYQDLDGVECEIERDDFLARVIQHEADHLNGVLFVDRLSTVKRQLLAKRLRTISEELGG